MTPQTLLNLAFLVIGVLVIGSCLITVAVNLIKGGFKERRRNRRDKYSAVNQYYKHHNPK